MGSLARSSDDPDVLEDGKTALHLDNDMHDGGNVTKPFGYSSRPHFYLGKKVPTWRVERVRGLSCGYDYRPKSTKELEIGGGAILGTLSLTTPSHCGGAIEGHLAWEDVYPKTYVDGVLRNPLPAWVRSHPVKAVDALRN
jgi:hypothetical protein